MAAKSTRSTPYPFAYYGEGSAKPIREKDGLRVLVVFERALSAAATKAVEASAPAPIRSAVERGPRWISFESSDRLTADVRAWAKAEGVELGASSAAGTHLAGALTAWIRTVHASTPVALCFVGSDGKRGPWHADTVRRFGERVRPVIADLRRAGASAHADWIALSFVRAGATTSLDDVRALIDDDPRGALGELAKRVRLIMPVFDELGPAALSALGPYGELCFWACTASPDQVPDLAAHVRHLTALADACPAKRKPVVPHLLVRAACSVMRGTRPPAELHAKPEKPENTRAGAFDAALALARAASVPGPLTLGFLELLVDAARELGRASSAVAMARPFLRDTIAAIRAAPNEEDLFRLTGFTAALTKDLDKAPDRALTLLLGGDRIPGRKAVR